MAAASRALGDLAKSSNLSLGYVSEPISNIYTKEDGNYAIQRSNQSFVSPLNHGVTNIPASTSVPSTFNGAKVDIRLVQGIVPNMKKMWIRWDISNTHVSAPVTMVPVAFFCEKIEILGNGGSLLLQTLYPETMLHHFGAVVLNEDKERVGEMGNVKIGDAFGKPFGAIAPSTSIRYYWPLYGNLFDYAPNGEFDLNHLGADIVIKLWLQNSTAKTQVEGSGTVQLDGIQLVIAGVNKPEKDMVHPGTGKLRILCHDNLNLNISASLTASTQYTYRLNGLNGIFPYFLWFLRSSVTGTSNGFTTFTSIGPGIRGAALELTDNAGAMWNGNTPIDPEWLLKIHIPEHWKGGIPPKIPIYSMFAGDPDLYEEKGIAKGLYRFTTNEILKITPSSAGTAEIQTVTLTNAANDGGYYQLMFRGDITEPLIYSTSAANMKVALEALPSIKNAGLSVTFSGTAAATFTITFSPIGPVTDLVKIIPVSLNDGGVAEIGVTTITTYGKSGFTTGTYQLDIFAKRMAYVTFDYRSKMFSIVYPETTN